jgi:hypothetical protein
MPDIFMHFIFKRWLSHKKDAPKPKAEAQQPAPKSPPKGK